MRVLPALILALPCMGCATTAEHGDQGADPREYGPWIALFDGRSLESWKPSPFGGEGEVVVEDEEILVGFGSPLSGITYVEDLPFPRDGYELELAAQRLAGTDFFCGLTFPVGPEHLTLIVGGWGGALVGLSSLDGEDASENETGSLRAFEDRRLYRIRVRVDGGRVQAWIDGESVVDVDVADRQLGLRPEVLESRPLGISNFATRAGWRDIRVRSILRP